MLVDMPFLHRRAETSASRAWWAAVESYPSAAPGIVQELRRSTSVVADTIEIQQAAAWARAHPMWRDDDPPFIVHDSVVGPR